MTASALTSPMRQQSVWVMVVLQLVTVGIYGPYWYFSRRAGFHALSSKQRLPEALLTAMLMAAVASAVLTIVSFFLSDPSPVQNAVQLLDVAIAAALLFFAFRVRGILRDHFATRGVSEAGISGLWTFIFNLFYLQYKINRIPAAQLAASGEGIGDGSMAEQHLQRGLEMGERGDWRGAVHEFDEAINQNPNLAVAYAHRGLAHDELEAWEQAIADYTQAIELAPDSDGAVHHNRGLAHAECGNREQAVADLEKAMSLTRDSETMAELRDTIDELLGAGDHTR